jgi:hypothetical protein
MPRLAAPTVAQIRDTTVTSATKPLLPTYQELIQATNAEAAKPTKLKNKRSKKPLFALVVLGALGGGGYYLRDTPQAQRLLGHEQAVTTLPEPSTVRPTVTSAEYSVTLNAVQNGVPSKVTTVVAADYAASLIQSTVETRVGGTFTTSQEIRNAESVFHPGTTYGSSWTRQPRVPESPSPYDATTFVPTINDLVDQTLRDAAEPTSSKTETVNGTKMTALTYVLDRASVPEIAPAIFTAVPWLFDVPNATTLTVEISYDETGLVRHLRFGVDPPQPGTGSDATWVTSYTMDVTSLNAPVTITVPTDAVDVPVGTP